MGARYCSSFFFIRYWDNGPHLRVRLLPSPRTKPEELRALFLNATHPHFSRIEQVNYIQEIQRYGGPVTIQLAEQQFYISSKTILKILSERRKSWTYQDALGTALQLHLLFLKSLFPTPEAAFPFLDFLISNWIYYSLKDTSPELQKVEAEKALASFERAYQPQANNIEELCCELWNSNSLPKENLRWIRFHQQLLNKLNTHFNAGKTIPPAWANSGTHLSPKDQTYFALYDSFIHMTNNRLGIHLHDEAFIAFLLIKGLKYTQTASTLAC